MTSVHTRDIPLASFITDTVLPSFESPIIQQKKKKKLLFLYLLYADIRESLCYTSCQPAKVHAQAAGSSSQAKAEFDRKHIGDFLFPSSAFSHYHKPTHSW